MVTRTPRAPPHANQPLWLILAGLGTVLLYTLSAELGLLLAMVHHNVTSVWPPSGIALAALLIFGIRLWPAVTIGAFTVNYIEGLSLLPAIGIATGNTLAALTGVLLIQKMIRDDPLDTLQGVLILVMGGGLLATMVSATIGTMTLLDAGLATRPDFGSIWLTWWLGDSGGVLLLTPLILAWRRLPQPNGSSLYALEAVALVICTLLVAQLVFGRNSPLAINHYPLAFLPLITLVWAAMRFGKHGVTACLALIAVSAVWGTIGGSGPFVRDNVNESLLLLQAFMGVTTVAALLLMASLAERRRAQRLLAINHEEKASNLGEILETSLNEIYMFDAQTLKFINVNHGARNNLGYSMEELRALTPVDIKPEFTREMFSKMVEPLLNGESKRIVFETVHERKDGSRYPVEVNLQLSHTGDDQVFVAIILDITERHATQQQLDHMAHHDPLTDLPNRFLFSDRLTHALQHGARTQHPLALMFLDLDGFKKINDSLGHPAGDGLLQQVAHRLQLGARRSDTVARLGGDEFTIILEDLDSLDDVPEVAGRILDSLAKPFDVMGREVFLSASIGISTYPEDGHDVTALMKYADVAMFQAKKDGGNRYQFYLADMTVAANQRLALETDLRAGLKNDELVVYFQPQISLENDHIVGLEALVRWQHPQHGLVPPNMFIPVAEESGLIEPLGEWVMLAACKQLRKWQETTGIKIPVAVNLSGHQINERLVQTVRDTLAASGLEACHLQLEITESCIMENKSGTIEYLRRLRGLGIELAVDDFGTGYSSMSYLKELPINKLKIDRSFVRDIPSDSNDMEIIKAIIALGHALNMTVIAEGVETREQHDFLAGHGCDVYQGYLFSPPLPAGEIEQLLLEKPFLSVVR